MEEDNLDMEMVLAEVNLASADLGEFMVWLANQDWAEEGAVATTLEYVYSYARAANQTEEEKAEE